MTQSRGTYSQSAVSEARAVDDAPPIETGEILRLVIVGHVDHGKSSLIGRLFQDTGSLPAEKVAEIRETCRRQSRPFELAYLMDALEEEREQNVTIDSAQACFRAGTRRYAIIDAPGHRDFLKNMITGAASAQAAILIVDALEGVLENTRRHAFLLALLGVRQVIVLINKMDLVGYSRARFEEVQSQIVGFLAGLEVVPRCVLPGSVREGDNIVQRAGLLPWWAGPTLLEALGSLQPTASAAELPLRMPVQDIYRWDGRRIYVGRVESGRVRLGQRIRFSPSGRAGSVAEILRWGEEGPTEASAGQCVGLTLADPLFVERGEVISPEDFLPQSSEQITASIFWLGSRPLARGRSYRLRLATAEVPATVDIIHQRIDSSTLEVTETNASEVCEPEAASVTFALSRRLAADAFADHPALGRFVIMDAGQVAGGGILRTMQPLSPDRRVRTVALNAVSAASAARLLEDLQSELDEVHFDVDKSFLQYLAGGHSVSLRLRDVHQLDPLAQAAYAHNIALEVKRERNRVRVLLYHNDQPLDEDARSAGEGI